MKVRAIVPQKALVLAKGRLATVLSPGARAALSLELLEHVCAILRAVPVVESLTVMTPDPAVRACAAGWGVAACPDPGPSLNLSLAKAIVSADHAGRRRGFLVIAADLPWFQAADLTALIRAARSDTLVLAPSKDGAGTNALLVPPGVPFLPTYGEGSRAAHRRAGRSAGLKVAEVCRPGLAFDVDTPDDLAAFHLHRRHIREIPGAPQSQG